MLAATPTHQQWQVATDIVEKLCLAVMAQS
jgi:hypothetical protein